MLLYSTNKDETKPAAPTKECVQQPGSDELTLNTCNNASIRMRVLSGFVAALGAVAVGIACLLFSAGSFVAASVVVVLGVAAIGYDGFFKSEHSNRQHNQAPCSPRLPV